MATTRRNMLLGATAAGAAFLAARPALAADPAKIGLILPMTGAFQSTGKQIEAACRLYMQLNGSLVAGRPVELIVKDDAGVPDQTKRLAQELVVNDKVAFLAGFGLTPLALAAAPIATRAKVPEIVMAAETLAIGGASPYIVRSGSTIPQSVMGVAEWAPKNGIRKVVTLVSDYGPGLDAETWFKKFFGDAGGQVVESLRVPLANPDFSPFLQRASDAKPDAIFVFVPSGVGAVLMKQFAERGLDKSGIKLIGTGDITDDDILNGMGDAALNVVTSQFYSTAHDSKTNKDFVAAFEKANPGMRPNFMAAGGWDGMHLIYAALEKTKGSLDGTALVAAMKGMAWESPRGPVRIDPDTREMVMNEYLRRVQKVNGVLYNVEFETIKDVKAPPLPPK